MRILSHREKDKSFLPEISLTPFSKFGKERENSLEELRKRKINNKKDLIKTCCNEEAGEGAC